MARLIETDTLANQNISSALAIGAHTCATVPRIVFVRVLAAQVAGGGDYIIYATLTKGGVEYRVIPITTATAAAALYSIAFVSVGIPMDVGDILTVYLDGLAGDTTTPDTQVDFYEADYVRPTTADRTLTVTATGEARAVNASDEALATATALATAQADLDNPDQYKANVSGLATALGLAAVAATVTTLINRVGAFTGTGVNTVLGLLKAALSKAASTPSDVGGTFNPATDSLEALREKADTVPTLGAGTVALTVTVDDGTSPIDGVEVDVTLTTAHANPVATGVSDAFGKVTFQLDPGTYYVWVQHARYNATNPTTVVVA